MFPVTLDKFKTLTNLEEMVLENLKNTDPEAYQNDRQSKLEKHCKKVYQQFYESEKKRKKVFHYGLTLKPMPNFCREKIMQWAESKDVHKETMKPTTSKQKPKLPQKKLEEEIPSTSNANENHSKNKEFKAQPLQEKHKRGASPVLKTNSKSKSLKLLQKENISNIQNKILETDQTEITKFFAAIEMIPKDKRTQTPNVQKRKSDSPKVCNEFEPKQKRLKDSILPLKPSKERSTETNKYSTKQQINTKSKEGQSKAKMTEKAIRQKRIMTGNKKLKLKTRDKRSSDDPCSDDSTIETSDTEPKPIDSDRKTKSRAEVKVTNNKKPKPKSRRKISSDDPSSEYSNIEKGNMIQAINPLEKIKPTQYPNPTQEIKSRDTSNKNVVDLTNDLISCQPEKSPLPKRNRNEDYNKLVIGVRKGKLDEEEEATTFSDITFQKEVIQKEEIVRWIKNGQKALEEHASEPQQNTKKYISEDYIMMDRLKAIKSHPEEVKNYFKYLLNFAIQKNQRTVPVARKLNKTQKNYITTALSEMTYEDYKQIIKAEKLITQRLASGESIESIENSLKKYYSAYIKKRKNWPKETHIKLSKLEAFLHSKGLKSEIQLKDIPPSILSFEEVLEKSNLRECTSLSCSTPPDSYKNLLVLARKKYDDCCAAGVWSEGIKFINNTEKEKDSESSFESSFQLFTESMSVTPSPEKAVIHGPVDQNQGYLDMEIDTPEELNCNNVHLDKTLEWLDSTNFRKPIESGCGSNESKKNSPLNIKETENKNKRIEMELNRPVGQPYQCFEAQATKPLSTLELQRILTTTQETETQPPENLRKPIEFDILKSVTLNSKKLVPNRTSTEQDDINKKSQSSQESNPKRIDKELSDQCVEAIATKPMTTLELQHILTTTQEIETESLQEKPENCQQPVECDINTSETLKRANLNSKKSAPNSFQIMKQKEKVMLVSTSPNLFQSCTESDPKLSEPEPCSNEAPNLSSIEIEAKTKSSLQSSGEIHPKRIEKNLNRHIGKSDQCVEAKAIKPMTTLELHRILANTQEIETQPPQEKPKNFEQTVESVNSKKPEPNPSTLSKLSQCCTESDPKLSEPVACELLKPFTAPNETSKDLNDNLKKCLQSSLVSHPKGIEKEVNRSIGQPDQRVETIAAKPMNTLELHRILTNTQEIETQPLQEKPENCQELLATEFNKSDLLKISNTKKSGQTVNQKENEILTTPSSNLECDPELSDPLTCEGFALANEPPKELDTNTKKMLHLSPNLFQSSGESDPKCSASQQQALTSPGKELDSNKTKSLHLSPNLFQSSGESDAKCSASQQQTIPSPEVVYVSCEHSMNFNTEESCFSVQSIDHSQHQDPFSQITTEKDLSVFPVDQEATLTVFTQKTMDQNVLSTIRDEAVVVNVQSSNCVNNLEVSAERISEKEKAVEVQTIYPAETNLINPNPTTTDQMPISSEPILDDSVAVKQEIFSQFDDDVEIIDKLQSEPMVIDDEETAPELIEMLLSAPSKDTRSKALTGTFSHLTTSSSYFENFPQAQQLPSNFNLSQTDSYTNQSTANSSRIQNIEEQTKKTHTTSKDLKNSTNNEVRERSDKISTITKLGPQKKTLNQSANSSMGPTSGADEAKTNKLSSDLNKSIENETRHVMNEENPSSGSFEEVDYISIQPQNIPSDIELTQSSSNKSTSHSEDASNTKVQSTERNTLENDRLSLVNEANSIQKGNVLYEKSVESNLNPEPQASVPIHVDQNADASGVVEQLQLSCENQKEERKKPKDNRNASKGNSKPTNGTTSVVDSCFDHELEEQSSSTQLLGQNDQLEKQPKDSCENEIVSSGKNSDEQKLSSTVNREGLLDRSCKVEFIGDELSIENHCSIVLSKEFSLNDSDYSDVICVSDDGSKENSFEGLGKYFESKISGVCEKVSAEPDLINPSKYAEQVSIVTQRLTGEPIREVQEGLVFVTDSVSNAETVKNCGYEPTVSEMTQSKTTNVDVNQTDVHVVLAQFKTVELNKTKDKQVNNKDSLNPVHTAMASTTAICERGAIVSDSSNGEPAANKLFCTKEVEVMEVNPQNNLKTFDTLVENIFFEIDKQNEKNPETTNINGNTKGHENTSYETDSSIELIESSIDDGDETGVSLPKETVNVLPKTKHTDTKDFESFKAPLPNGSSNINDVPKSSKSPENNLQIISTESQTYLESHQGIEDTTSSAYPITSTQLEHPVTENLTMNANVSEDDSVEMIEQSTICENTLDEGSSVSVDPICLEVNTKKKISTTSKNHEDKSKKVIGCESSKECPEKLIEDLEQSRTLPGNIILEMEEESPKSCPPDGADGYSVNLSTSNVVDEVDPFKNVTVRNDERRLENTSDAERCTKQLIDNTTCAGSVKRLEGVTSTCPEKDYISKQSRSISNLKRSAHSNEVRLPEAVFSSDTNVFTNESTMAELVVTSDEENSTEINNELQENSKIDLNDINSAKDEVFSATNSKRAHSELKKSNDQQPLSSTQRNTFSIQGGFQVVNDEAIETSLGNPNDFVEVPFLIERRFLKSFPFKVHMREISKGSPIKTIQNVNMDITPEENLQHRERKGVGQDALYSPIIPRIRHEEKIICDFVRKENIDCTPVTHPPIVENIIKIPLKITRKYKPRPACKAKKSPTKCAKITDIVPQKTHEFSSLPLIAGRKPASGNIRQQKNHLQIEECDFLIEDASQVQGTTTASQMLGTDCTYFENSELLRKLDNVSIPTVQPVIPAAQEHHPPPLQSKEKVINLNPVIVSDGVTARKVWQVNLQWKGLKKMSIEVRLSFKKHSITVCDEQAKLLFNFTPEIWCKVNKVLREIDHFEYKRIASKNQKVKATPLHKALRLLFDSASQVVNVRIITDSFSPFTTCEKAKPAYRKPFQCLTKGIASNILSRMKILKENLQENSLE